MKKTYITLAISIFWVTLGLAQITTYQYTPENWLKQSYNGFNTTVYTYDEVGNMTSKITISNTNLPDVITQNQNTTPTTINAGADTDVVCRVKNQGAVATTVTSRMAYFLSTNTEKDGSDVFLGFSNFGTLAINGFEDLAETITIPANTISGTYYILYYADDEFNIAESNEENNVSYIEITINGTTTDEDVTITNASINPTTANAGDIIEVTATQNYTGNQANADLPPIQVTYTLSTDCIISSDDITLGTDFSNIGSDNTSEIETKNITIPSNTNAGIYYILVNGDSSNVVTETDEDNIVCVAVTVAGASTNADLTILYAHSNPESIVRGYTTSLTYRVFNQGTETIGVSSRTGFYLSTNTTYENTDVFLGYDEFDVLDANTFLDRTKEITIPSNTVAGLYYILFYADDEQLISETDETNNVSYELVQIYENVGTEDVTVTNVTLSQNIVQVGDVINVSVTQNYSGNRTSTQIGPVELGRRISTDCTYSGDDIFFGDSFYYIGSNNPSQTQTYNLTIPNLDAGIYNILFLGDDNYAVNETDENNTVCKRITVIDSQALTYVPDDYFEARLESQGMGNGIYNDNYVYTSAVENVTYLQVVGGGSGIVDMTGIEDFVALEELYCNFNSITSLDVSNSPNLRILACQQNQITNLNITTNNALVELSFFGNNVTSIDVSHLSNLEVLYTSANPITSLDVTSNLNLKTLQCNGSPITTLDFSNNINLEVLSCGSTSISNLDLSNNSSLTTLWCHNSANLSSLDLRNGNNTNMGIYAVDCPNLTCISVDNASWSTSHWTNIDAIASFSEDCYAGLTYVPDNNFENYLETHGMGNGIANDDYVTTSNINAVTYLAIPLLNIADLTGIEDFVALEELHCNANQITNLDFSTNPNLIHLSCQENQITSLNISSNTNLSVLECFANQLTELDLSTLTQLTYLSVAGNQITSIDVSNSPLLTRLWCHLNQLTSLNVKNGNNTALTNANFTANLNPNLTCIEVDNASWSTSNWSNIDTIASFSENCNPNLTVNIIGNGTVTPTSGTYNNGDVVTLTATASTDWIFDGWSDDLNGNTNPTQIIMDADKTVTATFVQNIQQYNLTVNTIGNGTVTPTSGTYNDGDVVTLTATPNTGWNFDGWSNDLNGNTNPVVIIMDSDKTINATFTCETVNIPDNNFEQALIDLGHDDVIDGIIFKCNIENVTNLDVSNKNIADLTGIEEFIALENLNCSQNQITILDFSTNSNLTELRCVGNHINSLDISNNSALIFLDCQGNQLSNINVSNNTNLITFHCDINNLSSINVTNNSNLEIFSCGINNISTLDLTSNILLTSLSVQHNNLSILNLSNNVSLEWLRCHSNNLISLDFFNNTVLDNVRCEDNQLSNINLSNNTMLTWLQCHNNNLTELDLSNNTQLEFLWCNDNQLTALDIKNGNNINVFGFQANNNPNLTCIYVDDANWSETNWTDVDINSTFVETEADCTSLSINNEFLSQKITIFPNPTNSIINISNPTNLIIDKIKVYDSIGKLVKTIKENTSVISLENLANGVYFIKVQSGAKYIIEPIIKNSQ